MRKYRRWAACLATAALATVAAIGAPASAAPAPAVSTATIGTSSYDPATDLEAVTILTATAAATGVRPMAGSPIKCMKSSLLYKIYFRTSGYTLLSWKFNFEWCRNYPMERVTSMKPSSSLTIHSPAIRGAITPRAQVGAMPALVVRVLYEGAEFQYCPITSPTGANCVLAFHPKIDLYFQGNGDILDLSVT